MIAKAEQGNENIDGAATRFLRSKISPLRINQITHYKTCERYLRRHKTIGVVLVLCSTVSLGTTFFDASIFGISPIVIPSVSILVSILSALLAFMGDQARAMDHQASAVAYGALLRTCESRVSGAHTEKENSIYLSEFLKEWATVSRTSPLTRNIDREKTEKILEQIKKG